MLAGTNRRKGVRERSHARKQLHRPTDLSLGYVIQPGTELYRLDPGTSEGQDSWGNKHVWHEIFPSVCEFWHLRLSDSRSLSLLGCVTLRTLPYFERFSVPLLLAFERFNHCRTSKCRIVLSVKPQSGH